ncbi:MAG: MFS transporter [Acidimicrobiia bacterium]
MPEDTDRNTDPGGNDPTLRSLAASVYLPTLLFAIGQGAIIPQVALTARDLGASVAVAGLAVAVRGIGTMVFDIPSGVMVARLGERRAMLVATLLLTVSLIGCISAASVWVFIGWTFLMGSGWSVWLLARLTYVSDVMPQHLRGRALSTMGGVQRVGTFVGPFLGAGAVVLAGFDGAYYVHLALALAGAAVLYSVADPHRAATARPGTHAALDLRGIGRRHMSVLLTGGVGVLALSVLRASRQVVLPLWAEHIGLDAATVGVIFGASAAIDMTLFYPAGSISDRFGRKVVAVPCMTLMSVGLLLIPFTATFWSLVAVAMLLGFGNGLGSGIVMTLGADFSPQQGRAEFLGVWRLVGDVGTAGGPLVASAIAAFSLAAASVTVGVIGLAGAALVLFKMPEPFRPTNSGAKTTI